MKLPFNFSRGPKVSHRPRRMGGQVRTRSGRVLKVNSSMSGRWSSYREGQAQRKAQRLSSLPKSRIKRILWRMNPKYQAEYWFSRDGAIAAMKILGLAIFAFFILTIAVFAYYRKDIQSLEDLSGKTLDGSLTFYDRTGKVFLGQDYNTVKRVPVGNNDISQYMKDATVSIEDRDFYKHHGFDVRGVARASVNDVLHRGNRQGGSTITEQLVKLSEGWTTHRNLSNKIRELILAVSLERKYSKDDILRQYLNLAPYGGLDYGVQVAASDYFHTSAKKLTLPQAAFLASIPNRPATYSPYNTETFDKQALLVRYDYVLDSMAQTGRITQAQAAKAKKVNILAQLHSRPSKFAGVIAPYFMLAAEKELLNKYAAKGPDGSIQTGTWKVITTLDMNMQKLADQKVQANLANVKANGGDEEATVVEDTQSGQYLAEVGGTDFNKSEINYAQWPISPGSSIKPYDYSTLIQNRTDVGAGSVFYDITSPLPTLGYPCTNKAPASSGGNCLHDYDSRSPGPETIRYALGGSRNIPAVKAMGSIYPGNVRGSIDKTIDTAQRLMNNNANYSCYKSGANVGAEAVADRVKCFTPSAIGDTAYLHLDQHVNGLASLGRLGLSIPSTYILKIYDANGKVIPGTQWTQPKKGDPGVDQVVNPQTAYIVDSMLSDPSASYFDFSQKFQHYNGWNIAVKTGTTTNNYDGLMMAWTTKYAVGTWVGYHTDNRALYSEMTPITLPVTRGIMEAALDMSHTSPQNWQKPSGVQTLPSFHSRLPFGTQGPVVSTDLFPSWYKSPGSSPNSTIDKVSNKLATKCTPSLARENVGGSSSPNTFSVDIFYGPRAGQFNSNTKTNDDVHNCGDNKPSVDSFFINGNDVSSGGSVDCSSGCKVTTTVSAGTHPFNDSNYPQFPGTVNLLANGAVVQSKHVADSPSTVIFHYSGGSAKLSVQVVDSVLYSDQSAAASVKKTTTASLKFGSAKFSSGSTLVQWSGGKSPYSVTGCTGKPAGTSCTSTATTGQTVTIQDASNNVVSGTVQ